MTRSTQDLIGAIFCTATVLILTFIAVTGIGVSPVDGGNLSQDVSYEVPDHRG